MIYIICDSGNGTTNGIEHVEGYLVSRGENSVVIGSIKLHQLPGVRNVSVYYQHKSFTLFHPTSYSRQNKILRVLQLHESAVSSPTSGVAFEYRRKGFRPFVIIKLIYTR